MTLEDQLPIGGYSKISNSDLLKLEEARVDLCKLLDKPDTRHLTFGVMKVTAVMWNLVYTKHEEVK